MTSTPARKLPATARRRRRREHEVLDAAARVFHEHGYKDATVQHVAEGLGILKGSLYYYIDTKEDLLFRLLEQVHDGVDEVLAEVSAETEGHPPLERLEEYVRRQSLHSFQHLARLSVYYHDIDHLSGPRQRLILDRRAPHEAYVQRLVREAQADGTANPAQDVRMLSNCV